MQIFPALALGTNCVNAVTLARYEAFSTFMGYTSSDVTVMIFERSSSTYTALLGLLVQSVDLTRSNERTPTFRLLTDTDHLYQS